MQTPSEYLRGLIAENGGAISAERFMQEALYHPLFGYYANRVGAIGAAGDFSTAATLHEALPRAIAHWASERRREIFGRGDWHVIELGGGGGQMAEGFLRSLRWFARRKLVYHIVELSKPLSASQRQRLKGFSGQVHWHSEMADALRTAEGQALIISNEFVDAFPCLVLSKDHNAASGWREVMVSWPENSPKARAILVEWQPSIESRGLSSVLSAVYSENLTTGQRVEIHRAFLRWLRTWSPQWRAGRLLTIDYGDILPAVYHRQRNGTLRAYWRHQRILGDEIYRNFGQQDLTADVNFTDLQLWGESCGLGTQRFNTQAQFLREHLPVRWLRREEASSAAFRFLMDEAGAGGAFKVLEQSAPGPIRTTPATVLPSHHTSQKVERQTPIKL